MPSCIPTIPAHGRPRQEEGELEASLYCVGLQLVTGQPRLHGRTLTSRGKSEDGGLTNKKKCFGAGEMAQ